MNITPIFPLPIGRVYNFITPKERLHLLKHIKSIPHFPNGAIEGDGSSTFDNPPNLLDRNIKDRLQLAVDEFTDMYGKIPTKIVNIWSNIQNAGSRLKEHVHPDSIISGALYINVDQSCKLYVHNPNPYIEFSTKSKDTPYNYDNVSIDVENGELILFPSWLRHGNLSVINEMDERIVVSFNSCPK